MTSLAARFKRLRRTLAEGTRPNRTPPIVIRHASLEISTGARKTREHLDELKRLGCRFIQPDAESVATLEAVRSLISDARSGDLSARGETLEPTEVSRWLVAHTAETLLPLLAQVESGTTSNALDPLSETPSAAN